MSPSFLFPTKGTPENLVFPKNSERVFRLNGAINAMTDPFRHTNKSVIVESSSFRGKSGEQLPSIYLNNIRVDSPRKRLFIFLL